jgi:magnesium transporter
MADPLFGPEVRMMLAENDEAGMKAFCESLHPAVVAETLGEGFSTEEVWKFLNTTKIKTQAAIFEYFPIEWQVEMVNGSGRDQMAKLIEQMSSDDRADLLRRLRPLVVENLLRLVDEADRRDIATLVKYQENTAGALMTTDYAWIPASISVSEALDRLRLQAPDKETIYYVFVLDDDRKLIGVTSLRDLILAPRHQLIRDLMNTEIISVKPDDDREKVAADLARFDLIAIPVVDHDGRLLGIVTHDDAIDVVVQEATEDAQRMGGVGTFTENYLEANFYRVWMKRAGWLSALFVAELFTFTALAHFEDAIKAVVVLSMFVPLCIATGGNSGSQAATLITRAMALGQLNIGDWWRVLRHEILMGLVLGLTLGSIGFLRAAATPNTILSETDTRHKTFEVRLLEGQAMTTNQRGEIELPPGVEQLLQELTHRRAKVVLPKNGQIEERRDGEHRVVRFPAGSTISFEEVDRWRLGIVIGQSVAAICLWGTLVGSMLPLIFRRLGFDPAFASSPFVATFVDVTGIFLYFTIATIWIPLPG